MITVVNGKEITAALEAWQSADNEALLETLLLVREARKAESAENNPAAYRRITNMVLLEAIESLSDDTHIKLIKRQYLDGESAQEIAPSLGVAMATYYRWREKAIAGITRYIQHAEVARREAKASTLYNSLRPIRATKVVGSTKARGDVLSRLRQAAPPHQFVLSGIGGIGKTTQAITMLRELAEMGVYDHFIWTEISYDPLNPPDTPADCATQVFDQIRQRLSKVGGGTPNKEQMRLWFKQNRAVLIIDNVERETDANYLLEQFRGWLNPSKLVMTSRAVATGHPNLFVRRLDELPDDEAFALIRYLAELGGYHALQAANDAELQPIFDRTGGSPLAIELVIGLLQRLPLPAILADLPVAKLNETDAMYRRIFWQVWNHLSDDAKSIFKMMPLIGARGAAPDQMLAVTQMPTSQFWSAIGELTGRSLLIQKGNELDPRYGIHRISEQFLKVEVIGWQ